METFECIRTIGHPDVARDREIRAARNTVLKQRGRRPLPEVAYWEQFGGTPVA